MYYTTVYGPTHILYPHSTLLDSTPLYPDPLDSTPLCPTPLETAPFYPALLDSAVLCPAPLDSTQLCPTPFESAPLYSVPLDSPPPCSTRLNSILLCSIWLRSTLPCSARIYPTTFVLGAEKPYVALTGQTALSIVMCFGAWSSQWYIFIFCERSPFFVTPNPACRGLADISDACFLLSGEKRAIWTQHRSGRLS